WPGGANDVRHSAAPAAVIVRRVWSATPRDAETVSSRWITDAAHAGVMAGAFPARVPAGPAQDPAPIIFPVHAGASITHRVFSATGPVADRDESTRDCWAEQRATLIQPRTNLPAHGRNNARPPHADQRSEERRVGKECRAPRRRE